MQISKLDAAKLSQETTIKDLKANITNLQSKLNKLESEHDELGKKFSSHTVQADSDVKELQQVKKKKLTDYLLQLKSLPVYVLWSKLDSGQNEIPLSLNPTHSLIMNNKC